MATRSEVEKLLAKISRLQETLEIATEEVTTLRAENWELKRRLHRDPKPHPWRCPECSRWVKLLEAQVDMNDQILYVTCECKVHGRVTPAPGYTLDDLKAALPKPEPTPEHVGRWTQQSAKGEER